MFYLEPYGSKKFYPMIGNEVASSKFQRKEIFRTVITTDNYSYHIKGKFSIAILKRLQIAVDPNLREAGFRKRRSCTDQIATLRIIVKQSLEWNLISMISRKRSTVWTEKACGNFKDTMMFQIRS